MFAFGFLAYVQQKTITVAADAHDAGARVDPAADRLARTGIRAGAMRIFQMPGGIFGQRLGARRTFVIIGLTAFLATIATPLVPNLASGTVLFVALLGAQLLLGCSQGAIFPVMAGVFEAWFPPNRWAMVQGLSTMALGLGAALTPPLIANLMSTLGWQRALLWASLPALSLIALWSWYGRNTPREHPSVTERELVEIGNQPQVAFEDQRQAIARAVRQPQRRAVVRFLHEHELHLLPALQLGVSVLGARATILASGKRMARHGAAARRRSRRGPRRTSDRPTGTALR